MEQITKWLTRVSITARRACAFYSMKLALWFDVDITVRLSLALTQENIRRQMEMHGIDSFHPDYDSEGNEVIRVSRREPTIH